MKIKSADLLNQSVVRKIQTISDTSLVRSTKFLYPRCLLVLVSPRIKRDI